MSDEISKTEASTEAKDRSQKSRPRPRPRPSLVMEPPELWPKKTFAERFNPTLGTKDKELEDAIEYFEDLLRSRAYTLREILESTFEEPEVDALLPGPAWVAGWKRNNAIRYDKELRTRWTGHTPTLALKLALLYYGFSVEQLRPDDLVPWPVVLGYGEEVDDEDEDEYGYDDYEYAQEEVVQEGDGDEVEEAEKEQDNENQSVEDDEAAELAEVPEEDNESVDEKLAVEEQDQEPPEKGVVAEKSDPSEPVEDNNDELADETNNLSLRGGGLFDEPTTTRNDDYTTGDHDARLNRLFRQTRNTYNDAARDRILRDRSFTTPTSIFTNPTKPVLPLPGLPILESVIKTGPGVPGVSIAMMTPTEMVRLQREVHSLRCQLLDRTRECPYMDCDRYFAFSDGAGLDRHIREEHNVLRCFLCSKDANLLPYYDLDRIKEHFVKEHVDDVLKTYGVLSASVNVNATATATAKQRVYDAEGKEGAEGPYHYENKYKSNNKADTASVPIPIPIPIPIPEPFSDIDPTDISSPSSSSSSYSPPPVQSTIRGKEPEISLKPSGSGSGSGPPTSTTPASSPSPSRSNTNTSRSGNKQRKRKRPADLDTLYARPRKDDGDEEDSSYEYSEKSAVPDPLENIEVDSSPKPEPEPGTADAAAPSSSSPKRESPRTALSHSLGLGLGLGFEAPGTEPGTAEDKGGETTIKKPAAGKQQQQAKKRKTTNDNKAVNSSGGGGNKKTGSVKSATASATASGPTVTRTGRTVRASRAARGES